MPTTSYTTPTMGINVVGARTDASGGAVTDTTAEEARFATIGFTEGYVSPSTAFKVAAQTVPDMTVKVGSGTSKADYYVVSGEVAGQGNYVCRLDVTSQNVTIDAADASQVRTDEIYLVVRDHVYDASSRVLPQLGYRKGDLGGANPGPDAAWRASVLLARITVAAAATTITNANISDQRVGGDVGGIAKTIIDAKGDLIVGTAADTPARLAVGTNGHIMTADSAQSAGMKWAQPVVALLAESILGSPAASVTFGSIPQTYKHLRCVIQGKRSPNGFAQIRCRLNGDSSADYETQVMYSAATAVTGTRVTHVTSMEVGIIGDVDPSTSEFVVADYTNATEEKMFLCHCAYLDAGIFPVIWHAASHLYTEIAPVTSLQFFPDAGSFDTGTRISLYGMN